MYSITHPTNHLTASANNNIVIQNVYEEPPAYGEHTKYAKASAYNCAERTAYQESTAYEIPSTPPISYKGEHLYITT